MTDRIATAVIAREIDGDTFVVDALDPGWGVKLAATSPTDMRQHIRLEGVNAPDSKPSAKWYDPTLAKAATAFFAATWPIGTAVTLISYGFDDFGRTMAAAIGPDGRDVGTVLVQNGFARTGDYPAPPAES